MKLEYFPDGSPDCPLILLYDTQQDSVERLFSELRSLIDRETLRLAVHEMTGFQSFASCRLFFTLSQKDEGVVMLPDGYSFECRLCPETWQDVTEYLTPFKNKTDCSGFQWLSREGKISLLISHNRSW